MKKEYNNGVDKVNRRDGLMIITKTSRKYWEQEVKEKEERISYLRKLGCSETGRALCQLKYLLQLAQNELNYYTKNNL